MARDFLPINVLPESPQVQYLKNWTELSDLSFIREDFICRRNWQENESQSVLHGHETNVASELSLESQLERASSPVQQ